jgi:NADH-quinone oxidoreductase subunit A
MDLIVPLGQAAAASPDAPAAWLPIVLLLIIGVAFAGGTLALSVLVGPRRTGTVKQGTYESGMVPVGDARQRFNVRFYIVAVIFLVFDVEIVFFYPWAALFRHGLLYAPERSHLLLIEMAIFVVILLVAYFYAWGKGAFRWD